jgi:hypothetical protein
VIVAVLVLGVVLAGLAIVGWRQHRTWTSDARARRRLERQ